MREIERRQLLNLAQTFANKETDNDPTAKGAVVRTLRPKILAFGVSGKLPDGVPAIHAAVDAICTAARSGVSLHDGVIVLTHRPCAACAQAIVQAGIKQVFYAGTLGIEDAAQKILSDHYVKVTCVMGWNYEKPKE